MTLTDLSNKLNQADIVLAHKTNQNYLRKIVDLPVLFKCFKD